MINTHNGVKENGKVKIPRIDINDYPAIKAHLDTYWSKIKSRADQGDTPYNLRNCAYMNDFNQPKIMYSEIVRAPQFYLDKKGQFYPEATTFIMTGKHLEYLYPLFQSKYLTFFFKTFYAGGGLGENGYRYKKAFFEKVPIPLFANTLLQQQIMQAQPTDCIEDMVGDLYKLTDKEKKYILSSKDE